MQRIVLRSKSQRACLLRGCLHPHEVLGRGATREAPLGKGPRTEVHFGQRLAMVSSRRAVHPRHCTAVVLNLGEDVTSPNQTAGFRADSCRLYPRQGAVQDLEITTFWDYYMPLYQISARKLINGSTPVPADFREKIETHIEALLWGGVTPSELHFF